MPRHTLKNKRHTMEAVAQAAGVSTMTVSRVLRGTGTVATKTRQRVEASMRELGYVHNRLAGSLASSRSAQIAVIVSSVENIVFTEVLAGVASVLDGSGYQPVIGISEYDQQRELALVRSMLEWRPAGFVLTLARHDPETVRLLRAAKVPVVELMELSQDPIDMCMGLDHTAAGRAMAEHVISKGYRRFGYLGSNHAIDLTAATRFASFKETVQAHGGTLVKALMTDKSSGISVGRQHMQELLAEAPDIDLVYFSNDAVAAGAMMYCLAQGIEIPQTLALAGFCGLEIAGAMPIPITTISSPRFDMGSVAASQVLRRLAGEKFDFVQEAAFTLIPGESV